MKLSRFFFDLLFPPRCISCGSFCKKNILDECEVPFCDKCRLAWEREKTETCPRCGMELLVCRCSSERMERAGMDVSIKLVYYRSDKATAGSRAILYLKRNRIKRAFAFFAEQLSFPIVRYMKENGLRVEEVCLCYLPRSYKNADVYGVDQAEQLCRAIGKRLGARVFPLFYRTNAKAEEQKKLSAKERERNVRGRFGVNEAALKRIAADTRCIFLVDDVITTGASISACAKLLKGRYDGEIVAVSLARTPLARRKSFKKE